jgi:hypothetical protein
LPIFPPGLWKRCDFFLGEPEPECQHHNEFLAETGIDGSDFLRAEAAFVIIVIGMIFMAVAFSLYSLVHPRYMFKRLSGFLHIITTVTTLVVIELVKSGSHVSSWQAAVAKVVEHSTSFNVFRLKTI